MQHNIIYWATTSFTEQQTQHSITKRNTSSFTVHQMQRGVIYWAPHHLMSTKRNTAWFTEHQMHHIIIYWATNATHHHLLSNKCNTSSFTEQQIHCGERLVNETRDNGVSITPPILACIKPQSDMTGHVHQTDW